MRVIVLGAGAIGGVVGGRLHQHGHEVVLIARGEHLSAIRSAGLRLEDPDDAITLTVSVVGSPAEITFRPDDLVMLATKTQDARAALSDLREVAPKHTPIACATNGVEAERIASRLFPHVYGLNLMLPTAFPEPGVVQVISGPIGGSIDVGRYPTGADDVSAELSTMLAASQFVSESRPDVMRAKYRKLVMNCANAIEAACGLKSDASKELIRRAMREAETVLAAAGIDVATEAEEAAKVDLMVYRPINGVRRAGGSTYQSLATGRSIETDFLNGEISLIAHAHGIEAPTNALMQQVMHQLSLSAGEPASIDPATLLAELDR
jgi:2-dehydropantoate 2-reductase